MNKPAVIALVITLLDAMGIGLIMPVLPSLLREYLPEADVANHYGILLALYAVMQVCFAPLLGRWSDKLGRRPVLLLSLAGAAFDYTLLALSNVLWMLYLGRIISGITGATGAVAASVVAGQRAYRLVRPSRCGLWCRADCRAGYRRTGGGYLTASAVCHCGNTECLHLSDGLFYL